MSGYILDKEITYLPGVGPKRAQLLEKELGIPGNAVYISYWGTSNWGWNGGNF